MTIKPITYDFFVILIVVLGFLSVWLWFGGAKSEEYITQTFRRNIEQLPLNNESVMVLNNKLVVVPTAVPSGFIASVPFTSQAPFAQWDEDIFQGACEESSVIMVMHWVRGTGLTAKEATDEIRALAEFQKNNYGYFYDTSAADTFKFFGDYFNYSNVELVYDINGEDIRAQIDKGNIVIVPINGQKVSNPYYVPPGPIAHMLVVVDYDKDTNEFVTHDPGTRHGSGFRYSYGIFENALADYPTGYHEPITNSRTAMIIVKPSNTTSSY